EINQRHDAEIEDIVKSAREHDVAVVRTPTGFALAPMRDGKVLDGDEQEKLTEEEQKHLEEQASAVHDRLHEAVKRVPQLQREQRERVRNLDQEVIHATTSEILDEPRRAFSSLPTVIEHLDAIEQDVVEKSSQLIRAQAQAQGEGGLPIAIDGGNFREGPVFRRYRVNLMVDHRATQGAPVEVVDHPTSGNLVGKVEHMSQLGILVTDFNLIKPGALHQANGGYLLIDARRLLSQPVSYEQLKRVLRSGEIRIESVAEALDLAQTVSLEPEPIPWRGKVVLVGERWIYHRLSALDPEFDELFKVAAEFETTMDRTEESCRQYAGLLARVMHNDGLRPMDAAGVARILDHTARMAGHAGKLSMHVRTIFDLVREADHWAAEAGRDVITAVDVQRTIDLQRRRTGRVQEQVEEMIDEDLVHVRTDGSVAGQINALTVVELGSTRFGFPTRVTASARLGSGGVVAIDREVQMGGPVHNKGVLILASVLGSRYLPDKPSALRATLVFEQMYGYVDGDSASLAELLALLSAVGEIPLRQGISVTGSIDQLGRVQAVGGLNEKIEGFFHVCEQRGLDGSQGVVIPTANVRHLMLDAPVVTAVAEGRFHVWAVEELDQALEIVTGLKAGERGYDGRFPEDSANGKVEARLEALAKAARRAARKLGEGEEGDDAEDRHVVLADD
ncbi:MAG: ATP-binding protein, partial [Myxococcales bacterium]